MIMVMETKLRICWRFMRDVSWRLLARLSYVTRFSSHIFCDLYSGSRSIVLRQLVPRTMLVMRL